jgi:hypothetical protein
MAKLASRRVPFTVLVAVLTASALLKPLVNAAPGQGGAGAAAALKSLSDAAAKGNLDQNSAYDSLVKAGMSSNEANAAVDQLRDVVNKFNNDQTDKNNKPADDAKKKADDAQKKAEEAKQKDQNASGSGDWNMGQVYRDRDYKVKMPLTNACRVDQTVTITYPQLINLTGPKTVDVPAKTTVDVDMVLEMTKPPMPLPPWPPGMKFDCYDLKDNIKLVHPELKVVTKTSSGTDTYVCDAMERTYSIGMHVHQHGPPQPDPPGGGGGDKKKKPSPTCQIYWNHNEFYPTPAHPEPERCKDDIRAQAADFFGPELDPIRKLNPSAWEWAPKPLEIERLTVAELMQMKARADTQAGGKK